MGTIGQRIAEEVLVCEDSPNPGNGCDKWTGVRTASQAFWDDSCGSAEIAENVIREAREDLAKMIDDALDFDSYQERAFSLARYPNRGNNIVYPILGLCGETGEVCEKVKKVIRDKGGLFDLDTKLALRKELGDVLWYLSALSKELGFTLSEVAFGNIEKLEDRRDRGVLHGSGDSR